MRRIFIKLKRKKKQAILFMIFLCLLNGVLHHTLIGNQSFIITMATMCFSLPIVSIILGIIPAVIPIKKLFFLKRWLTYSYLWLLIFNCFFLAADTIIIAGKMVQYFN